MANDSLAEVMKKISKKYGDNVVRVGAQDLTVDGVLSLGSPSLDFCIYGGVPEGRIVEFSGPEGSGKTTNAFLAAASYQRAEVKRNPENPRSIVFLDNEGTLDREWAAKMGYDISEDATVPTILIRPEAQSAEEIFDMALDMLKTGEVGLLIVLLPLFLCRLLMSQWRSSKWEVLQKHLLDLQIQLLDYFVSIRQL